MSVATEPWWNLALSWVSWFGLLLVTVAVLHAFVTSPSKSLNLRLLHHDLAKHLLPLVGLWVAAKVAMSPAHYSLCNEGHVQYCYVFLDDLFSSLYACLMLMCGFVNAANYFLVVFFALYTALPSPLTCWWLLSWSLLVLLYQFWAMGYLATDRPQRVGLLHMNYAMVVLWLLVIFAYPPAHAYAWGESQSSLRDWQAGIHVLVAGGVAGVLWMYSKKGIDKQVEKEELPMRNPEV